METPFCLTVSLTFCQREGMFSLLLVFLTYFLEFKVKHFTYQFHIIQLFNTFGVSVLFACNFFLYYSLIKDSVDIVVSFFLST